MNSSLEKLNENLSDDDLRYLTEEFGIKNFELLRQKDAYSYEYNFEKCKEEKLRNNECFYSSVKDGKTDGHGEKLDGHIGD